jgi:hypothetical protein
MDKQKAIEAKRRFHAKQRELGLCLECTNQVKLNCSRCETCLIRRQRNSVERKALALECNLCTHCVIRSALGGNRLCEQCYYQSVSHKHFKTGKFWKELKTLFEKQDGKCALSGFQLSIGVDADLDHILPSFRGGSSGLDNVQWVLRVVNQMKTHSTEKEFFSLVESLYFTMKGKETSELA